MEYGIAKIFSPDDGRELGLQGMINHMIRETDYPNSKAAGTGNSRIKREKLGIDCKINYFCRGKPVENTETERVSARFRTIDK